MTSLQLLAWIVGGIVLQLAVYLTVAFARHWQGYEALQHVVDDNGLHAQLEPAPKTAAHAPPGWSGFQTWKVVRRETENALGDICSFYLQPVQPGNLPAFFPGQFLTFKLEIPRDHGGNELVVRCYSLSDAPGPDHYRVTIKRVPAHSTFAPGRSSNYFHDHVDVGTLLQVRAPSGHFYLEAGSAPIVLIAGGIGITPMLGMLNWCAVHQPEREVWLFYGVRNAAEIAMPLHLRTLATKYPNFRLHLCFSDPAPNDLQQTKAADNLHAHASRVDVALLRALLPLKPFHFYICGPTPMLQSLVPALDDWGVPDAHIHFEAFGPASIPRKQPTSSAPAAPTDQAVHIEFKKSGKRIAWEPGSGNLLAFAEAHGIAVDSGCRSGSCGSCQTTIHSGEVAYGQAPDFDAAAGSCLMCVGTPQTDLVLEA